MRFRHQTKGDLGTTAQEKTGEEKGKQRSLRKKAKA